MLKDIDKYGNTPLDLLLETLSLSTWQGKVDPHGLLSTVVRLIGVDNSLWTLVDENSSNYEGFYNDENTTAVSFNHNRDLDNNSNIHSDSNSNCEGRNDRMGDKGSGTFTWINEHASMDEKKILTNESYRILRHFDEQVVIPVVEIAKYCEITLWNIPVVMQSTFLAVRQMRYHLLVDLLKSFPDQLFQHLGRGIGLKNS